MNALMNIQIRVLSAQAQSEIKALRARVRELELQIASANRASSGFGAGGLRAIEKWGSQMQWAGRQLQYNFTIPIALAAGAATKFALDNERAMTRLKKVYGDGIRGAQFYQKEIKSLERAFESLSNEFGVARADVINIAADWAAAGSSGLALAKSTRLTIETMILGELDAETATKSLIAIQAQYGQSTADLITTIDILNQVENQTGASMADLIDGFVRAAGVARDAGIDVRHLSAMIASLVPAAGSAAQAGNAIKTIISRIISPTKEAAEVMQQMGIHVDTLAWNSLNGTQRIEAMAKAFDKLKGPQKDIVSSVIASRWQINKFSTLMRDVTNVNGYYQKSLEATIDPLANQAQRVRELNMVLDSSPQKFKQILVVMQNVLADAIQPMLPWLIRIGQAFAGWIKKFNELDPHLQTLILALTVSLALIGPLMRYIGSLATLYGYLASAAGKAGSALGWVVTNLWKLAKAPFLLIFRGIGLLASAFAAIPTVLIATIRGLGTFFALAGTVITAGLSMLRSVVIFGVARIVVAATTVFTRLPLIIAAGLRGIIPAIIGGIGAAFSGVVGLAVRIGPVLLAALTSPWTIAIGGVLFLMWTFRDKLLQVWHNIQVAWAGNVDNLAKAFAPVVEFFQRAVQLINDAFWALPKSVRDVMLSIITMVRTAAENIANFFSGIFGGVQSGATQTQQTVSRNRSISDATTATSYQRQALNRASGGVLRGPGSGTSDSILVAASNGEFIVNAKSTSKHYDTLQRINADRYAMGGLVGIPHFATGGQVAGAGQRATAGMSTDLAAYQKIADALNGIKWNREMTAIAKGFASALPLFQRLLGYYNQLNIVAQQQAAAVDRQEKTVAAWKARLDAANNALDAQQNKLDALQKNLDTLTTAYDQHRQALQDFASAPIQGMDKMNDAIFDNQMAQKKLQLQMLQWEKQHGSIDKIRNSMALLQGAIEKMQGNIADLRSAGAGSDITGPLEAQVKAMKDQYAAMGTEVNNSPISQMQTQLEDLQKQGEMLDLENAIKFDPMKRAIDELANGMKELPFDQIINGIKNEQAAMDTLQPKIDAGNAAIEKQKAVIDAATAARDAIQERYDLETAALDILQEAYGKTEDAIRNVEEAMRGLSTAAQDNIQAAKDAAANKLSPGAQNFVNAAGADFPEIGKNEKIGREAVNGDLLGDQAGAIDQWLKDTSKQINFDGIDMFKPIRDQWDKAWAWVEKNVVPVVKPIWDALSKFISDLFSGGGGGMFDGVISGFQGVWETLQSWWQTFLDGLNQLWLLFGDDIMRIFGAVADFFGRIWNEVGPGIIKFFQSVWDLTVALWPVIKTLAELIGGGLLIAFKVISTVISTVLGPVLNFIVDMLNAIIQVATGVIEFFAGIFTGDLSRAFAGIMSIVDGLWDGIFAIFNGVGQTIWSIVQGIIDGILAPFKWLYDVLIGHSIIPDLINGIVKWFSDAWKWVVEKVAGLINGVIDWFKKLPGRVWDAMVSLGAKLDKLITDGLNGFLAKGKAIWNGIIAWWAALPQNVHDKFFALKDKLGSIITVSLNWFLTTGKNIWTGITTWFASLPQAAHDKFFALKDKLGSIGTQAMKSFFDKIKELWNGAGGILAWFGGIPKAIGDKLAGAATVIGDIIRKAWNAAAGWINVHAIKGIREIASKFGLTIPYLPGFADGGIIPGGRSAKDNMLIRARSGEGVLIPEAVDKIGGKHGLESLNKTAKRGGDMRAWLEQNGGLNSEFGIGGSLLDNVTDWLKQGAGYAVSKVMDPIAGWIEQYFPNPEMLSKFFSGTMRKVSAYAQTWGRNTDAEQAASTGLTGLTPEQVQAIKNTGTIWPVGNAPITAGFPAYPGGGYHGGVDFGVAQGTPVRAFRSGRVIESGWNDTGYGYAIRLAHANGYSTLYGHNKNLLRSVGDFVNAGQRISTSGSTGRSTGPHLHFGVKRNRDPWQDPMPFLRGKAFDAGGYLLPGMTAARNATGKPEPVFTAQQWSTLSGLVAVSSTLLKSMVDTQRGTATGVYGSRAVQIEQRLRALEAKSSTTTQSGGGTTININGDLVLPNIKSGDDADKFIQHLKTLAG